MRTDREPLTESLCRVSLLCAPGLLDGPLTGGTSTEVRSVQTSWLVAEEAKVSEVKHSEESLHTPGAERTLCHKTEGKL